MKQFIITLVLTSCIYITGCSQKTVAPYYTYKTECMGVELDGSQTVKAWGNGRNKLDAVEQAKKNAVRDVIFHGLESKNKGCNSKPLTYELNAEERHEAYFQVFFADDGAYKNYISLQDERILDKLSRDKKKTSESVTHGLVVRVLRAELKEKLKQDGIVK